LLIVRENHRIPNTTVSIVYEEAVLTTCLRLRCSVLPLQTSIRVAGVSASEVLLGFRNASRNIRGRARLSTDEHCYTEQKMNQQLTCIHDCPFT